jgi:hypothetical protein
VSEITLNTTELKELLKSALIEILQEQKEVFTDIIIEAMEEGENTETVNLKEIFHR